MRLKKMYSIRLPSAFSRAWVPSVVCRYFRHTTGRIKVYQSGEAFRAFSGISVSIRCRYAFSPASVVLSPSAAFTLPYLAVGCPRLLFKDFSRLLNAAVFRPLFMYLLSCSSALSTMSMISFSPFSVEGEGLEPPTFGFGDRRSSI